MVTSVAPLSVAHDVKIFDCGEEKLNTWLATTASQHKEKILSGIFVLEDDGSPNKVLGYYALNIRGLIQKDSLPPEMAKRLPSQIPAYTLGRLAISINEQKKGYGEYLLLNAMFRVKRVAAETGGTFLFVDAKNQGVADFYAKYDFVPMSSSPLILAIKISDIADMPDSE